MEKSSVEKDFLDIIEEKVLGEDLSLEEAVEMIYHEVMN